MCYNSMYYFDNEIFDKEILKGVYQYNVESFWWFISRYGY